MSQPPHTLYPCPAPVPVVAMVDQATLPTYFAFFPLFRAILVRERITIVHGHTATSPLIHDCILQAKIMGYKAMFTGVAASGGALVRHCRPHP